MKHKAHLSGRIINEHIDWGLRREECVYPNTLGLGAKEKERYKLLCGHAHEKSGVPVSSFSLLVLSKFIL